MIPAREIDGELWIKASDHHQAIKEALAQPEQKPMHPDIKKLYEDYFDKCFRESSVAQRTWVGLTDEERQDIALEVPINAVCITEAKLKKKNFD